MREVDAGGERDTGERETICLGGLGPSVDWCVTLGSAVWLLIGPGASTSSRPSLISSRCAMGDYTLSWPRPCFTGTTER